MGGEWRRGVDDDDDDDDDKLVWIGLIDTHAPLRRNAMRCDATIPPRSFFRPKTKTKTTMMVDGCFGASIFFFFFGTWNLERGLKDEREKLGDVMVRWTGEVGGRGGRGNRERADRKRGN